jgi:hypothetical protein
MSAVEVAPVVTGELESLAMDMVAMEAMLPRVVVFL